MIMNPNSSLSPRLQDTNDVDGKSKGEGSVGCAFDSYSLLMGPKIKEIKYVRREGP